MSPQTMSEKDQYLAGTEREFQTTLKCIKAFPADKLDMKPSPKSNSARDVIWTLAGDNMLAAMVAEKDLTPEDFKAMPPAPKTLDELIKGFEESNRKRAEAIEKLSDEQFNSMTPFIEGPGKMGQFRRADVFWFCMMDSIHHRGQLSVYLRLAGAKVPSIYGPTADEPWY